ncbi:acetylgalactosaminyl-O-glycosyl-glycoprotein beta-1,3-N-acetylglucosaminyltransferase-like [Hemicordylus capensis]|uniref:acetylgalactosaminyl-O-glycosyl-glycoprotein beta-1,3-N-acetylglucosaminyltransferase-like n=1 Tax=Hemicordylus capensis TaxID=884348 RepID=UPI002304626F|nr:acetylgalactosaminyl-O-glycosyl-glycoprotein beta-1,3-N-acetylglucosaminyltransferase-like [Hemicordylus capensis]XP_053115465.1 acetylgalactosaminyl-O-glycosyl-glycoprotein beta-1,3-N-acetylglucosaminyltransferase-like [Hemicordylus capensis]
MKITRRTLQLSMVAAAAAAAGVLALVCLYANLGPGAQQPGPGPLLSPAAGPQRSSIVLTDSTFTFHLQPSLYEAAFPHLQRYQCQEVIPVASLCQGAPRGKLLLLMAIKSHPMSRGRRATLRRTWAQARDVGGYRVRPLFLVANISGIQHINLVKQESRTFEDILLWDFMESHHNLSLKERCFLQWLHKHCQQAAYIFKGDDDLFVNPKALTEYLSWTPNASHFIHGNIQHHSAVMSCRTLSRHFQGAVHHDPKMPLLVEALPSTEMAAPRWRRWRVLATGAGVLAALTPRRALRLSIAAGTLLSMGLYIALSQPGPQAVLCEGLRGPQRGSLALADGPFTFHLQPSRYEAAFPHLQRYRCQGEMPAAGLCQGAPRGTALLLLAIKSQPGSSSRRATLRRTWAQARDVGGYRVRPVFLVATAPDLRHMSLAQRESQAFGDVLLWDFTESHHNRSLKERCFLQWAHEHCQQAAYIWQGDDHLFVNLKALIEYLRWTRSPSDYIQGNIRYRSPVVRWGKYAIPHSFYPLAHYPAFASGAGLILPGPFVPALFKASACLPVFPLNDVYLGFLALAARLPFRHDGRFRAWKPRSDQLEAYRISLTVPGISLGKTEQLWKELWSKSTGKP